MDRSTHAWLAVEAFRKVERFSHSAEGKKRKAEGLRALLGNRLSDVVVGAWLPDSLIKDMSFGHVFKNSAYRGGARRRASPSSRPRSPR